MPKDRAEVQDQYKIGGGQLNEYEFDINKGAVEGQASQEGVVAEGLQGAAEPGLPQNVAERIRQVEEAARRKVGRRSDSGETRAVTGRAQAGAQGGAAKKGGGAARKGAAKKAAGGAKRVAEKSGTISRGGKTAAKSAGKKGGTKGAAGATKGGGKAAASQKRSPARKSPAKSASKGSRTQAGGGSRSSG